MVALGKTKIHKNRIGWSLLLAGILVFLSSCNMLKHVPEDQYLLKKVSISSSGKLTVSQDELRNYLKQKPNKRVLGFPFYLWLYNRENPDKENRWNDWLRNNGEPPVLWNPVLTEKTKEQFQILLQQKGYYHALMEDTVRYHRRRKVDVTYRITPSWPYTVRRISYDIQDPAVASYVLADTVHSLLHSGMPFDTELLQKERRRIREHLMDQGYFGFSEYAVTYDADTVTPYRQADLTLKIRNVQDVDDQGRSISPPFPVYHIRHVTINGELDYNNLFVTNTSAPSRKNSDTIRTDQYTFVMHPAFPVHYSTLMQSTYVMPDSLYRLSEANRTYQHLMDLKTFKLVNVQFTEANNAPSPTLDCQINLLPFKMQHYGIEVEGTNSGGNIGGAVNLVYQHKSLFHHAEILDLKILSMIEAVQQEGTDFHSTYEYGVEAGITVPKFLIPFAGKRRLYNFYKRYNPRTSVSSQFNYQLRPDYERTIVNISLAYNWNSKKYISHTVRPIDVNFVRLPFVSDRFQNQIAGTYLENSYTNHMVLAGGYTFLYNNQSNADKRNFTFFRSNLESAGLVADAFTHLSNRDAQKPYTLFSNEFSQFFKVDMDYRYYQILNSKHRLVYRMMAAVGIPYGNSHSIPFERKYYGGGANSLRGWSVRTLGPGSYQDTIPQMYPNSTGDIKLEVNAEYRFKLFWILEGALFADAGNVWDMHKDAKRPGADFDWDRFYREIAVSAGVGIRFDVQFFVFRTDIGFKLRDPVLSDPWDRLQRWRGLRSANLNIGIGYPF